MLKRGIISLLSGYYLMLFYPCSGFSQESQEVESIYLRVDNKEGTTSGYVICRDKEGNMVVASGTLLIGKYRNDLFQDEIADRERFIAYNPNYKALMEINVSPVNFEWATIRLSKDKILAVPFNLGPGQVESGDIIEAEFRPINSRLRLQSRGKIY